MLSRVRARSFGTSSRALLNHGKPQNPPIDNTVKMRIMPIKREGETLEVKRARLLYQSRKRGILESDLLLSRFAKKYLGVLSEEDLDEFDTLLDEADWDIYYWATKNFDVTPLPDKWKDSKILKMLQEDAQNKDREIMRMPELHE
ncbi:succinate dehydrogenase assembly factor 2, mitochondrial [Suhomyces tanzawaensis NRRL Y-17324]|uniref:Succinate dehydrogenase assembly factor 2, mitochondrial n=1 Tax=Suhomyces tanzawaensis NRRL Y-17324 TaxID=984487 RepID=A0A1E4SEX2_9ASCO|nr:succinate dehydrogenase assembly factor 2, mitochondrial [Suhomyces tanzawaensis NRRL Y-17324]ODV77942.1 succinate dehydrogenase assembly factor 2, mitochondrial [Suhomyces tanzawaensis NRRL Y-17324]